MSLPIVNGMKMIYTCVKEIFLIDSKGYFSTFVVIVFSVLAIYNIIVVPSVLLIISENLLHVYF